MQCISSYKDNMTYEEKIETKIQQLETSFGTNKVN